MYIMSQDGTRLAQLTSLEIIKTKSDGMFSVYVGDTDMNDSMVAKYPTVEAATAQLAELSRAILRGIPLYCFDEA